MPWNKDGSRKSAYPKKSGFKMNGLDLRNENKTWTKNEAGYDVKTTERKNLFGRKREVKKYYDPTTGEKLGKQVTVDRGKGDPRAKKQKIKKVNPGLMQSRVVGKIRLKENPWESGKSDTEVKPGRVEFSSKRPELKEFVKKDSTTGKESLASYKEAWDDGRFTTNDGKRTDKFGNEYTDDQAGYDEFVKRSKKFWSDMAGKTKNEELRRDTQTGKMDAPMKKKRGYKMKRKK